MSARWTAWHFFFGYLLRKLGPSSIEVLDEVRLSADDVLASLGHGEATTPTARKFWLELVGSKEAPMSVQELEGYEELLDRFLSTLPPEKRLAGLPPEQRLAGLPPEQRLAGLPPEQRLAGLPPEQRLAGLDDEHATLALPVKLLQALSPDYVASLSPEIQAEIRRRLNNH